MFCSRLRPFCSLALVSITVLVILGITCLLQTTPAAGQTASDKARQEREQLFDLGKKAYEEGDYAKAEPLLKQGLQLAEKAGARAGQADFLNLLGLVCYSRGEMQKAMEYYQRALPLYQNYPSKDPRVLKLTSVGTAIVLNNMGNAADQLGQIKKSLEYKQEALAIREQIGDKVKIADSYNGVGIAYEHLNQYNKALDYYERALKLGESIPYQKGIADVSNNMGNVYDSLGEYDKALAMYGRALDVATALDDKMGRANALNNLASTYETMGQLDKALELLQDSLKIKKVYGNGQDVASTLHNLGNVFDDKGQYDEALDYLFQALELRKQSDNPKDIADTSINIGNIYMSLGRWEDAQNFYEQARIMAEKSDDKITLASYLVNLANFAARQGQYEAAIALEKQALALRQKVAGLQEVVECWINLGAMHNLRGKGDDYDRALEYYHRALPGAEAAQNKKVLAMLLDNFGATYQNKHQYERAILYHKRALELRRKIGILQDMVFSLINLGGAYQRQNRLAQAEDCFQEAAQAFEKVGEHVGDPRQYGVYQQPFFGFYGYYADLELERKHEADALITAERGRARGVALQAAQNTVALESRLTPVELAKKRELEQVLAHANARLNQIQNSVPSGDPEEEKAHQNRLRIAQRDFDTAESNWQLWRDAFYAHDPEYRRISGQTPPDISALTALAHQNPDTLFLEWQLVDRNRILLFALSSGGVKAFRLFIPLNALEKQLEAWLNAIQAERYSETGETERRTEEVQKAAALYRLLFGKVEAAGLLRSERCKRLVLVADGVLLRVPFAALVTANGKRLIERYAISSAISLGSLTWPSDTRPIEASLLCIADPLGKSIPVVSRTRGEFGGLAGALQEGEAIKTLLPATRLLIGAQAEEARVKREMPNYSLLHFATHASLDSVHPLHSALLLAPEPENSSEDGFLEAREIAGMHLSARFAVLSACRTAGGQIRGGEGLMGLTWAFRAAGCPSVMATQWEINDTATANLMRVFYHALVERRRKDDALRTAIQAMIADKTRQSPYYWAAFQIIGDASPVKFRPPVISVKP